MPQVGGQVILPAAAMFEMAATAGCALVDDSQTRCRAALSSVAIAAPVPTAGFPFIDSGSADNAHRRKL